MMKGCFFLGETFLRTTFDLCLSLVFVNIQLEKKKFNLINYVNAFRSFVDSSIYVIFFFFFFFFWRILNIVNTHRGKDNVILVNLKGGYYNFLTFHFWHSLTKVSINVFEIFNILNIHGY